MWHRKGSSWPQGQGPVARSWRSSAERSCRSNNPEKARRGSSSSSILLLHTGFALAGHFWSMQAAGKSAFRISGEILSPSFQAGVLMHSTGQRNAFCSQRSEQRRSSQELAPQKLYQSPSELSLWHLQWKSKYDQELRTTKATALKKCS